jgi:hypothetical protein
LSDVSVKLVIHPRRVDLQRAQAHVADNFVVADKFFVQPRTNTLQRGVALKQA